MFGNKAKIAKLEEELAGARKKISDLEAQYNSISTALESMVEGVIIVEQDTKIFSINPSVEKIFGILRQEALGRLFLEVIRNNDISEVINKVLTRKSFVSQELNLVWPIQRIFQVNASPISIRGEANFCGCLLVIHDITEIRKLETMRRDFLANVSHELKTPLTSINGFVETLLEGAIDDKENNRQFLRIIKEHGDRLGNLINDLLELSAIESGQLSLELQTFALGGLISQVLSGFKSRLKKKTIEVGNDIPDGLLIKADRIKIEQVLVNLIDNAIKFSKDKGFIRISSEESPAKIKVIFEDSGIGIPAKDIPRIFERFYRVDKARSRELGGTGLGLAIVKHIIELHGGSVGVDSVEGLGSKFSFILYK